MSKNRQDVTNAELGVLRELWKRSDLSTGELAIACYGEVSPSTYATVQKLLTRLIKKRHVRRKDSARPHVYEASVSREQLIEFRLIDTAKVLCKGSFTPLLTQLVRGNALTESDREALLKLIKEQQQDQLRKKR